jgi:hypothetical protein
MKKTEAKTYSICDYCFAVLIFWVMVFFAAEASSHGSDLADIPSNSQLMDQGLTEKEWRGYGISKDPSEMGAELPYCRPAPIVPRKRIIPRKPLTSRYRNLVKKRSSRVLASVQPASKFSLTPSVGLTYLTYNQSGNIDLIEGALTFKAAASYVLTPLWSLWGAVSYTGLALQNSPSSIQLAILNGSLMAKYQVISEESSWNFSVSGGWYYSTSFPSPRGFGYSNMNGPQIFSEVGRVLNSRDQINFYLKYSPISNIPLMLSFSNAELASGLSYHIQADHPGDIKAITFDVSRMIFHFPGNRRVDISSFTLGVSFGI